MIPTITGECSTAPKLGLPSLSLGITMIGQYLAQYQDNVTEQSSHAAAWPPSPLEYHYACCHEYAL